MKLAGGVGCDCGNTAASVNPVAAKTAANRMATTIRRRSADSAGRASKTKVLAGAWVAVIDLMTRAAPDFFRGGR